MHTPQNTLLALACIAFTAPAAAQATFYENGNYQGRSMQANNQVPRFDRYGFNDRRSSVVVVGKRWEVCEDTSFRGECVVLRPGRYPSLAAMGLNNSISSARAAERNNRTDNPREAPEPVAVYDSRRRGSERLYEADVTSARAVLATPGQQCWVEREQLGQAQTNANVPAALAGALIGGILGHQVGGGSGNDIATVGGVIAGAALGANDDRDGQPATQDVQRCRDVPGGSRPAYWDVSYTSRGQEHRMQMTSAPGQRITVNERSEPRQQ